MKHFICSLLLALVAGATGVLSFCNYSETTFIGTSPDSNSWPKNPLGNHFDACLAFRSYIRPDVGGALQPWILTLFQLLFHIVSTIPRMTDRKGLNTSMVLTLFFNSVVIAITINSYASTHLSADKVLAWMPLSLVVEAFSVLNLWLQLGREEMELHSWKKYLCVFFYLAIMILQIVGLVYAGIHIHADKLRVTHCSPLFTGASAVQTSNCTVFDIIQQQNKGLGCISLEGTTQRQWLPGTVIAIPIFIAAQIFDGIAAFRYLSQPGGTKKYGRFSFSFPWITSAASIAMLAVLIALSVSASQLIPPGMTPDILLAFNGLREEVCQATLISPGLRGLALEWSDGVFNGWGCRYYGGCYA
ncbi:hypothetical protein BGZ57DRAFT_805372 [Hyaloscypha finlandica]|nr:hypothetical protein BGZ57DRAFT_805372 [Hyaloscypha finlandica]